LSYNVKEVVFKPHLQKAYFDGEYVKWTLHLIIP